MGRMTINLPRLGETMEEARVTAWLVAPNVAFKRGDILLEVETDKTVVEVPALQDGVMLAHLVGEGDVVALEAPIAEIETAGSAQNTTAKTEPTVPAITAVLSSQLQNQSVAADPISAGGVAASPAARAIARQMKLSLSDVAGTGRNGRVTSNDMQQMQASAVQATVVLLHGLFDSHNGWRELPQRLMRAGNNVVNLDLPGHGGLLAPAKDYEDAVQIISRHIIDTLQGQHLIIVGHSLGAALGASVAAELQKQPAITVKGLLMLAPAGLGARINVNFIDGMMAASHTIALKKCLALLDAAPMSDAALTAERARLIQNRPTITALVNSVANNGFQQIDIVPALETLKLPVAAVFGTKDQIINWQDCAALPQNTAVHFLRDGGHLQHLSVPDFVVHLIHGFNRLGLRPVQAA